MKNLKKLRLSEIILICIFFIHDMPVVGYKFPSTLYAIVVLSVFFILISKMGISGMKDIIPIYLISLLNFFVRVLIDMDFISMLKDFSGLLQLFIHTMVGYVVCKTNDYKSAKKILYFYAVINIITCFTTSYGCSIYPEAARHLAVGDESVVANYGLYKLANIGGFAFVYTMVLSLPILIYWFRNSLFTKFNKLSIFLIILIFYTVIKTEYTIALLLLISLSSLFFLTQKNINIKQCILTIVLCICTFELFAPLISDGLNYVASNIESVNMSERLNDLSLRIIGEETDSNGDLEARNERYMKSINVFLSNPLGFWFTPQKIGGHSYILDNLARFGIIGIFLIWIMIKSLYKNYVIIYKGNNAFNYATFMLFGFIVLISVNTTAFYIPLTFTLPLFLLTIKKEI